MTELEKLEAGLPYNFYDSEVVARKNNAVEGCRKLKRLQEANASSEEKEKFLNEFFGTVGREPTIEEGFMCDNGKNIHVGDEFLANYNVTILDIMPVTIGNYVWIGPNTLISTVNHPINPQGRREHLGIGKPVSIGDDVWIGGNATILPGVTIDNNVVVAAGSVVTKDIPDNSLVAGVPAKVIKTLENDVEE